MTEFTKTKIHFALALLGTMFAVHPFLQQYEDKGFLYLGYELRLSHVYVAVAGLLALCVYCFGLTLVSEKPHSWLEKLGNYSYALAVMVVPFYGGLYLASLLADQLGQSHLAWAAPGAALGLGVIWFVASQLFAWLLRGRLGKQDRSADLQQLARNEVAALGHSRDLFASAHYDLSVMEMWKAVEAGLRRALLGRGVALKDGGADVLIHAAKRAAILKESSLATFQELKKHWTVAISSDPISREAADAALAAGRHILATIPLDGAAAVADSGAAPTLRGAA